LSSNPLVVLAREDARLFHLKQQIAALPRRIAELDAERARVQRQIAEAEARWDQAESARRRLETELAEFRAKRVKSEGRLGTLTSTEQYQALVKEMATQSEKIDALEVSILEAMERSDEARKQRDLERARLGEMLQGLRAQQEGLQRDLEAARAGLVEQSARRDAAATAVDGPTRVLYDRILKAKKDAAIGLLAGSSCGICKGVQTRQVIQLLHQNKGMQSCQMCGRILVWDPES
jgi:hypothetical protein